MPCSCTRSRNGSRPSGEALAVHLPVADRRPPVAARRRVPAGVDEEDLRAERRRRCRSRGSTCSGVISISGPMPDSTQPPRPRGCGMKTLRRRWSCMAWMAASRSPKTRPRCISGVRDRLAGRDDALRRRGVRPGAEEQPRRRSVVPPVGVQVELEAVAARPGQLADEVLAGGVVAQDEHGVAMAVAAIAAVDAIAGLGQVVPLEVALVAPVRVVEVAQGIERQRCRSGRCERQRGGRLQHAAPREGRRQRRRLVAGVGDLQPAGQHRRAVQQRVHPHRDGAHAVAQRQCRVETARLCASCFEPPTPSARPAAARRFRARTPAA